MIGSKVYERTLAYAVTIIVFGMKQLCDTLLKAFITIAQSLKLVMCMHCYICVM